jgi:predicted nucleic acid-binding protein
MAVIDASVYIALINAQEREHARCWAWFEATKASEEPTIAPVILLAEVAAALSRGVGDAALAHQVIQQLKIGSLIELAPVTLTLAGNAAVIAADYRIRGCDAVYVALAAQLDQALITLDRQQLERAAEVVTVSKP